MYRKYNSCSNSMKPYMLMISKNEETDNKQESVIQELPN